MGTRSFPDDVKPIRLSAFRLYVPDVGTLKYSCRYGCYGRIANGEVRIDWTAYI